MKGYFKGELRPCECGEDSAVLVNNNNKSDSDITCYSCGRYLRHSHNFNARDLVIKTWNNRPAFDKAIDALIKLFWKTRIQSEKEYIMEIVPELTGLAWAEALEIYKHRQEANK